jgi:hypothetical protein
MIQRNPSFRCLVGSYCYDILYICSFRFSKLCVVALILCRPTDEIFGANVLLSSSFPRHQAITNELDSSSTCISQYYGILAGRGGRHWISCRYKKEWSTDGRSTTAALPRHLQRHRRIASSLLLHFRSETSSLFACTHSNSPTSPE